MFTNEFQEQGRRILQVGSGRLTGREIIQANEALLADGSRLKQLRISLVDLSDVDVVDVSTDDVRVIAGLDTQLSRLTPGLAVAIVAPKDHVFGMARMWETLADTTGWDTKVFRVRAEADAWLEQKRPMWRQA